MTLPSTLFSIVTPDYEPAVPRERVDRMLASVEAQTCRDFEHIVIHDGPHSASYRTRFETLSYPTIVFSTATRYDDFGHSLRDLAMRRCSGRYVLHLNADNLLYPDTLAVLAAAIAQPGPAVTGDGKLVHHSDLFVFPILMRGMALMGERLIRFPKLEEEIAIVLSGAPARRHMIDCMQLVMRRDLWLAEGGWSDKTADSDSKLYPRFIAKYGARYLPKILGEHW